MKYLIKHKSYGFVVSSRSNGFKTQYSNKIKDAKVYTDEGATSTIGKLIKAGERESNLDKLIH